MCGQNSHASGAADQCTCEGSQWNYAEYSSTICRRFQRYSNVLVCVLAFNEHFHYRRRDGVTVKYRPSRNRDIHSVVWQSLVAV